MDYASLFSCSSDTNGAEEQTNEIPADVCFVSRAVVVTDAPLHGDENVCETVFPPNTDVNPSGRHAIHALQVGYNTQNCPRGMFMTYLWTPSDRSPEEDLFGAVKRLLASLTPPVAHSEPAQLQPSRSTVDRQEKNPAIPSLHSDTVAQSDSSHSPSPAASSPTSTSPAHSPMQDTHTSSTPRVLFSIFFKHRVRRRRKQERVKDESPSRPAVAHPTSPTPSTSPTTMTTAATQSAVEISNNASDIHQVEFCSDPDHIIHADHAAEEARAIFERLCPNEDFLVVEGQDEE